MSIAELITFKTSRPHVWISDEEASLHRILQPQYNLAIYRRLPGRDLQGAVQKFMRWSLQSLHYLWHRPYDWHQITRELHEQLGDDAPDPLSRDMVQWCKIFVNITGASAISIYLKKINHDACEKFHIDGYTYRLLCTYHGPGTEWTYNDNVNRKYLGEGTNDQIIKDWNRIERINTFDVAILKGELPHQRNGKGIVHRSPPVSQCGEERLVFRIDLTA